MVALRRACVLRPARRPCPGRQGAVGADSDRTSRFAVVHRRRRRKRRALVADPVGQQVKQHGEQKLRERQEKKQRVPAALDPVSELLSTLLLKLPYWTTLGFTQLSQTDLLKLTLQPVQLAACREDWKAIR